MRGSLVLAGAVVLVWAVLYVLTQVLVVPPLPVLPTISTGVVLTVAAVLGYPSVLRGPRSTRRGGRKRAAGPTGASRASGQHREDSDRGVRDLAAAGRSVPLRGGLTPDTARRTCELLRPMLSGDAVAITDAENVLAYVGPGEDHHVSGQGMQTAAAPRTVRRRRTQVARNRREVGCRHADCEVSSAVIAPLWVADRVVGTLGVYQARASIPSKHLVEDMAKMLSLHLELAELDRDRRLATDARLNALRAQINPHFLFNILNTIASKSRTRPEEARELLLRLSDFFRYAVRQEGQFVEFAQEYFFVRTYLSLEQARYGDRLAVSYDIDPQVLTSRVPVLTIQPLVENAVKHGVASRTDGGTVRLRARMDPLTGTVSIRVSDNGPGIDAAVLSELSAERQPSPGSPQQHGRAGSTTEEDPASSRRHAGVGLRNITERLSALFGDRYDLRITTPRSGGTVVDLQVPRR